MSIYHFGPFRLDAPHLRLFRHDAEVFIKGLAFGILHKLAEHASAHPDAPFVSKDELQRSVWQGAFVSDEAIRSAVRHVRRALDDDTEHAHLLKTEKRLGWGLTVPVRKSTEASSTSPLQPPHLPYAPPFYVERPAEERALTGCAQYPGRPVFLCGPQGSGKDTLLSHVLDGAAKAVFPMPTRVVRVAFSTLQPVELVSFEACLFAIARKLLDELHVSPDAAHEMLRRHVARAVDPLLAFRRIARELFAHDPGITHLIFHDTETLACDPRHVPFFDALRSWPYTDGLSELRIFLLSAVPPRLFPASVHSPWWTKTARVSVDPLTAEQILHMAAQHGLAPSLDGCARLRDLVGGLAGLCRVACFYAASSRRTLDAVLASAALPEVFRAHLADLETWLTDHPSPSSGLTWRSILHDTTASSGLSLPREIAWPLVRKGLIHEPERPEVYHLRCPLYRHHLRLGIS